jgi:Uncharacterized protein conserved in bacteria
MRTSATDQIFQYWQSLRRGDDIPRRLDVNPMDLKAILPKVFFLEQEPKDDTNTADFVSRQRAVTFRLAGTDLCDTHMRELTRTAFRDIFITKDRPVIDNELKRVFEYREVKLLRTQVKSEFAFVEIETVVMPLINHGVCDRILGCQSFVTDRRSLWWKGSYPISGHSLLSVETISKGPSNVIGDPRLQPPAYEVPVLEFSRRNRRPDGRSVGHLVVIDGGAGAG